MTVPRCQEILTLFSGNSRMKAQRYCTIAFLLKWLTVSQLSESEVKPYFRVCSRHFPGSDTRNNLELSIGKRFASPTKKELLELELRDHVLFEGFLKMHS